MSSSLPITGQVAQILSDQEIAINRGLDHGVKEGMTFSVMSTKDPIEITDPESNLVIGTVDRVKVKVEVSQVYENFSVCRTQTVFFRGGILNAAAQHAHLFADPEYRQQTLNVSKNDFPRPIDPDDSYVKRGDKVVQNVS